MQQSRRNQGRTDLYDEELRRRAARVDDVCYETKTEYLLLLKLEESFRFMSNTNGEADYYK